MKTLKIPLKNIQASLLMCVGGSLMVVSVRAQSNVLTLSKTVEMALANSNTLKLKRAAVDRAVNRYNQARDLSLPTGSISGTFSHAEIPANHIRLGSLDWILPDRAESYMGNASLSETIFNGFKLKYARQSTLLLTEMAKANVALSEDEVIYAAIQMYFDLYKVSQSQKIIQQNIAAIDKLIQQADQFYRHGIVTKNDVLRFRLQKSAVEITASDLEANRKIICYNIAVLLGLPDDTALKTDEVLLKQETPAPLNQYITMAFAERKELKQNDLQYKVEEFSFKTIQADELPKLSLNAGLKYIHAGSAFIPSNGNFIVPFSVGATVSWDFSTLWMNKNKRSEIKIIQQQTSIEKSIWTDKIRTEVNQAYQLYQRALNKVSLLHAAIDEATENDRMQEDRYRNNVTTVTDRIDADVKLYQALTDLEIARAEASVAWYNLLKVSGKISTINQ
ncbi:transporter [Elizabethkingia meningoseptica]|uniref:TolC family protein n=2 Tax=Elizabethkingia meningoseptica TaxID=238 RepID=UPI000332C797|nr:TolC family protein [Elizabethkingia meningoseptica]AQX05172.1 transporter [Elizabethkingia meningoseptica]AQX47217.1 transporter [Elizabethkingia meningoseptica]EOR29665.1 outer membrane efflux protein [Elizabethkingia meningoseptica ATCC 13253 = NBRC 12535]OPB68502.1 transporter [Elizabethkingia meningoseptica]SQG05925.1 type I secretion outer membrane protein, TolC family [Elizabethkingia meningoseptica]